VYEREAHDTLGVRARAERRKQQRMRPASTRPADGIVGERIVFTCAHEREQPQDLGRSREILPRKEVSRGGQRAADIAFEARTIPSSTRAPGAGDRLGVRDL
jgi:hypothetical protein